MHRLLAESVSRWQLKAWAKDGTAHRSEVERLRAELAALKSLASAP